MDVRLGEADAADGALPVAAGRGVLDALLAENMRAGLEHHLTLPLSPAPAHDLRFVILHLYPQHLLLGALSYPQVQLHNLTRLLLLILD